jgi:hypothetical protein
MFSISKGPKKKKTRSEWTRLRERETDEGLSRLAGRDRKCMSFVLGFAGRVNALISLVSASVI